MRFLFTSIFVLLFISPVLANKDQNIIALVNKWNDIHKSHKTGDFLALYAPEVLFYGKNRSSTECYWLKERFLSSAYTQEITSTIDITHYKSGIVKAGFIKHTKAGKKVNEQVCYLLFKKVDGTYKITGESDVETDEKNNIKLELGEVDDGDDSTVIAVVLVCILTASFGWWKYRKSKQQTTIEERYISSLPMATDQQPRYKQAADMPDTYIRVQQPYKKAEPTVQIESPISEQKEKGESFEKFVVERFNKTYFTLKEWRSDKYHNGTYPLSNMSPDLEYHFQTNHATCNFAVECKWRAGFIDGAIEWAKDYQLENYRRFSYEKRMPVFVILGVGGAPANPNNLYIIPLNEISSVFFYQSNLKKYYRYGKSDFFFEADSLTLR